jgi:hypothetical protein
LAQFSQDILDEEEWSNPTEKSEETERDIASSLPAKRELNSIVDALVP